MYNATTTQKNNSLAVIFMAKKNGPEVIHSGFHPREMKPHFYTTCT